MIAGSTISSVVQGTTGQLAEVVVLSALEAHATFHSRFESISSRCSRAIVSSLNASPDCRN
jgi:hypothetical protein